MIKDPCTQRAYYTNTVYISQQPSPDLTLLGGCDCSKFYGGDPVVLMLLPLCIYVCEGGWACVDPENFCQRGPTISFFLQFCFS